MTLQDARQILTRGGELVALTEAFTAIATNAAASLDDLMLGLRHPGFVAEQAALMLYKRTGRRLPDDRRKLMLAPDEWRRALAQTGATTAQPQRGDAV